MIADLAATIAKQGAPTLGVLIGSAIGGPAGTALGGLAGKALETLADALGSEPEPDKIAEAIRADPKAAEKIAAAEEKAAGLIRVWEAEVARAAKNDEAEAEAGFASWQRRRTITTYAVLAMLAGSFFGALAAGLGLIKADTALLMTLVSHGVTLFMAWNGLVSGGRAVTDAVKAWSAGKAGK